MVVSSVGEYGLYLSGQEQGSVAGFCIKGNESSGSIKEGEFRNRLSEY
jgi:hypothetical protein